MAEDQGDAHQLQDEVGVPTREVPLGTVVARIFVVSGMSFAAALGLFFLIAGLWVPAIISFVATVVFLFLMFAIEKNAES